MGRWRCLLWVQHHQATRFRKVRAVVAEKPCKLMLGKAIAHIKCTCAGFALVQYQVESAAEHAASATLGAVQLPTDAATLAG